MILITGSDGFVGRHLTQLLGEESVVGYDLSNGQDITNYEQLKNYLALTRPEKIYHLAAVTSVPDSFSHPVECMATNIGGSINLLEAVRELHLNTNILLASSTEVYSPAQDDTPLTVASAVQPKTPYGVSKLAMEQLGAIYASTHGMHIVVTRTNNHTGPGQDGPFALTSFARQIVNIERGTQKVLKHGDLSSYKSYLDVRDVVRAYQIAIDLDPYIYNITSPKTYEIRSLLYHLIAHAKCPITTSIDTSLVRPYKPDKTTYETSSILKEKGWEPEYNIHRTLNDLLKYWRSK